MLHYRFGQSYPWLTGYPNTEDDLLTSEMIAILIDNEIYQFIKNSHPISLCEKASIKQTTQAGS